MQPTVRGWWHDRAASAPEHVHGQRPGVACPLGSTGQFAAHKTGDAGAAVPHGGTDKLLPPPDNLAGASRCVRGDCYTSDRSIKARRGVCLGGHREPIDP